MKNSLISALALGVLASSAASGAFVVTGITTTEGWTNNALNSGTQSILTISAGGTASTALTTADGFTGNAGSSNGIHAVGTAWPGYTEAQTDVRVDTGALNVGDGDEYTWTSATVGASDSVFVIFNGATGTGFGAPDNIQATDGAGALLGVVVDLTGAIADSDAFGTMDLARDGGVTLSGRSLFGLSVPVSDFGVDASLIKGVKFGTVKTNNDHQMVGFATVQNVPEPSVLGLAGLGVLGFLRRRR